MTNFYDAFDVRPFALWLDVQVTSQSVELNRSYVSWVLRIRKDGNSTPFNNNTSPWSVTIAGQNWKGNYAYNMNQAIGSSVQVASGGRMVYHNANGTMNIGVESYFNDSAGLLDYAFIAGSMSLPTIPRASTPTFSSGLVDIGDPVTINTNRASTSFTHTIKYTFGSASGTIATGVTDSYAWTPPLSLLNEIPTLEQSVVNITLETYSGATLIGTKSVNTLTLRAPDEIVPDFTTITHSDSVAAVVSAVGAYVQNVSKPTLAITGAVGAYGSTIVSHKIEIGTQVINAQSGTVGSPLSVSGTVVITGTVTDSRGRVKSRTVNINVLAYAAPVVTSITSQRSLSDGTPADEGTYIRFNINASVSSLVNTTQRNAMTYRLYTRPRGTTTWTLKDTTAVGGLTFNGFEAVGTYSVEESFDTRVEISDLFSTVAVQSSIAVAAVFMHLDGADGVGIGKYRENGRLDVSGDGYFSGKVSTATAEVATSTRVGASTGLNVLADNDSLQALNNGADATLSLNPAGGDVHIGDGSTTVVIDGNIDNPNLPYKSLSGTFTSTAADASNSSGTYWTAGNVINFPAGFFTQTPVITVSVIMGGFIMWAGVTSASSTSFTVRLMRIGSYPGTGHTINWTAVQQNP